MYPETGVLILMCVVVMNTTSSSLCVLKFRTKFLKVTSCPEAETVLQLEMWSAAHVWSQRTYIVVSNSKRWVFLKISREGETKRRRTKEKGTKAKKNQRGHAWGKILHHDNTLYNKQKKSVLSDKAAAQLVQTCTLLQVYLCLCVSMLPFAFIRFKSLINILITVQTDG